MLNKTFNFPNNTTADSKRVQFLLSVISGTECGRTLPRLELTALSLLSLTLLSCLSMLGTCRLGRALRVYTLRRIRSSSRFS